MILDEPAAEDTERFKKTLAVQEALLNSRDPEDVIKAWPDTEDAFLAINQSDYFKFHREMNIIDCFNTNNEGKTRK